MMAHICWCLILFSVIIIPSQVKACQRATPIPKRTVADGLEELLGITKEIIERECQTSDSVYCACYKNEIDGCHNKTLADECHWLSPRCSAIIRRRKLNGSAREWEFIRCMESCRNNRLLTRGECKSRHCQVT